MEPEFRVGDRVKIVADTRGWIGTITCLPGAHSSYRSCYGVRPKQGGNPRFFTPEELEPFDAVTRLGDVARWEVSDGA